MLQLPTSATVCSMLLRILNFICCTAVSFMVSMVYSIHGTNYIIYKNEKWINKSPKRSWCEIIKFQFYSIIINYSIITIFTFSRNILCIAIDPLTAAYSMETLWYGTIACIMFIYNGLLWPQQGHNRFTVTPQQPTFYWLGNFTGPWRGTAPSACETFYPFMTVLVT